MFISVSQVNHFQSSKNIWFWRSEEKQELFCFKFGIKDIHGSGPQPFKLNRAEITNCYYFYVINMKCFVPLLVVTDQLVSNIFPIKN